MSADVIVAVGRVEKAHGELYDVTCIVAGTERRVLAKRNGKMTMRKVRLVAGDEVTVEISPYDLTRARIVWRGRKDDCT